jgi:hypothetical protein
MKKFILLLLLTGCYWQFVACNSASPETYFGIAVLNCNMMHGFAGTSLQRELESPSVKMVDGNIDNVAPMKRKEIIDNKIEILETNLAKLKALKKTDDTRYMLEASVALYDYVLPVYKNEYRELARLYDENSSTENVHTFAQSISDKYYSTYLQLFEKLTKAGKKFAEKHAINVNWDVRTSPM